MTQDQWLAEQFEGHRAHLRAVAYRLLGSMADAEDAVQDTWLRLTGANAAEVENLGGWLTTVVARVSLNMLRARRRRNELPVGYSWPGASEAGQGPDVVSMNGAGRRGDAAEPAGPEEEAVLADSVGLALLVVLDTLAPAERLAFVLHDLFAMSFAELGAVLGRSTEAARQLASRARRRVRGAPVPDQAADLARQREVASAFLAATRGGDLQALVSVLDADVTLTGDGFAAPSGRPTVMRGVAAVSKGAVMASERAVHSQLALLNGNVGIVYAPAGRLQLALAFTVSETRKITAIDIIADPDRLRQQQIAVLPD
jgi:RNA polymerase sigma factor (sigma-70 family)